MASAMNVIAKYLICVIDLRRAQQRGGENAPPWQNKSMWIFYVELVTGMSTFVDCSRSISSLFVRLCQTSSSS